MILILTTRHTRKQGANVRLLQYNTKAEHDVICRAGLTVQGISDCDNAVYAWGDWAKFTHDLEKSGIEYSNNE